MIKKTLLIVSMCICALAANAQTYIEHLQAEENGKGRITVDESLQLDSVINNILPELDMEALAEATDSASIGSGITATGTGVAATAQKRGVNHVIKSGEKVNVYRILVYSGGNTREAREKAHAIAAQVNAKIPGSGAIAYFSSPRWNVITGAYATHEVAVSSLKRMKAMGFSQASLVIKSVTKK